MSSPAAALAEPLLDDGGRVVVPSSRSGEDSRRATVIERHHHHRDVVLVHDSPSCCSFVGNAFWILLGGWHLCLPWLVIGILLCCTVVGIPAGMQCFHIAQFVLLPFGKTISTTTTPTNARCCRCCCNILWTILVGWFLALHALVTGVVCCMSIVGLPWGIQCFRFVRVCIAPWGVRCNSSRTTAVLRSTTSVDTAVRQLEEEYEPLV